jgi:glycosyltransferase involved in cell wall biosynthesis
MRRVIVSVTNDLSTDNRVDKVCRSIRELGAEVLLVGRQLPGSLPLDRPYSTHRMRLLFRKGFLFYAEYNIRLFFFLLFRKASILHSNDLDTLAPNCMAGFLKRIPVVYDSHEYFTEVPEITGRPVVQNIWKAVEALFFGYPAAVFTVNQSIADLFEAKYKRRVWVMRNIPSGTTLPESPGREVLGLPGDRFILILQGSGINMHRGGEEMLEAMTHLDNSFLLLIVGHGDVVPWMKEKSAEWRISDRVQFLPRMPYAEMMKYTQASDLGLTLDKPTNINYLYSLPNKIFDYIRAGIPVLASDLPEVSNIINTYQVGYVFNDHDPANLARQVAAIRNDKFQYNIFREHTKSAALQLAWENEVKHLTEVYQSLLRKK